MMAYNDARQDRSGQTTARRRESILATAADQFAADGYQGASLRQVAAECGLAQGHLYYYYRTKQELLYEIIARLQQRFNAALAQARESVGGPASQLHTLLLAHVL